MDDVLLTLLIANAALVGALVGPRVKCLQRLAVKIVESKLFSQLIKRPQDDLDMLRAARDAWCRDREDFFNKMGEISAQVERMEGVGVQESSHIPPHCDQCQCPRDIGVGAQFSFVGEATVVFPAGVTAKNFIKHGAEDASQQSAKNNL